MNLAVLFLISAHAAVAADPTDPTQAAFEVTEKRLENFKESQAELDRISKILVHLGDPRKPQKGESIDGFYERVDRIYRHRAQGLVLLQMEYEQALSTRYELEADLNFYLWEISSEDKGFAAQQKQKQQKKKAAKDRSVQLENELLAVQAVLYQAAEKERKSLLKKESRTWQETQALAELSEDVKSCEAGYGKSRAIDDAIKLQEKYAKSSLPELRAVYRDAEVRADSAKFEYQYLEYDLSPGESADLQKLLGERYGHIFEEARKTVAETKDLEKRAARVAVLAQQLRERMRESRSARTMLAKRKQLREFMGGEDRRIESLRIIAGLPTEAQRDPTINRNMEDLWGKGSEDAAEENSSGKEGSKTSPDPRPSTPTAPAPPKPSDP